MKSTKKNTLKGNIEITNSYSEVPLLPFESCTLGSINISKCVIENSIDWLKLKHLIKVGVRFLDSVIDKTHYPFKGIEKVTKENRKIGLGVMGFADMLIKMDIPYGSDESFNVAAKVMGYIENHARTESAILGHIYGSFPNFRKSCFNKHYRYMRNATVTSIAPTGGISLIANTSSGIEPLFGITYVKFVSGGWKLIDVNEYFKDIAKQQGFYNKNLTRKINHNNGSLIGLSDVPKGVQRLFATALDIKPELHVKMQSIFQKYVDNAVSKTVNLPANTSKKEIRKIFLLANKLKCKGITIHRNNSKCNQLLNPEFCFI